MARDKQPLGLEHPSQGSMTLCPETMQWYLVVIFARDFSVVILHALVYLFVNMGLDAHISGFFISPCRSYEQRLSMPAQVNLVVKYSPL